MNSENVRVASAALIIKKGNPEALELGRAMQAWLRERGVDVWLGMHESNALGQAVPPVDVVFSLGGDGTFVSVARDLLDRKIPLVGVNFGQVGFLTRIAPETWQSSLTAMLEQGLAVEPRMALAYRHSRDGRTIKSGMVINDVAITRGELARLVSLELRLNNELLTVLRADGIILSTPTGSSGYARSSGGPLLFPSLNAYAVTAICPYLGAFPPIVLESGTHCAVTAGKTGAHLYLNLDGQETYSLEPGDTVTVFGVPDAFRVVEPNADGYFEKLRSVGFIQGGF